MKKKQLDAAELMAKLNADPEFVAKRSQEEDARLTRVKALKETLSAVLSDLQEVGCRVGSMSELTVEPYPNAAPHPKALPVLLKHLQRPYSVDARELLARALAVPEARFGWSVLTRLYRDEREARAKDGLAVAIAAAADDELICDVIELVGNPHYGSSRLLLLSALARSTDPRARAALIDLGIDPELGTEARRLFKHAVGNRSRVGGRDKAIAKKHSDLAEASMNFDLHLACPFLEGLAPLVSGFGSREIAEVLRLIESMEVDDERELRFEVTHEGRPVQLRLGVLKDDIDALSLYFFTDPKLAGEIDGQMKAFCGEHGI